MVKRGAVVLILTFLCLCIAAAAVESDKASLDLEFAGTDLKAVVGYKNPASIVTPEPRYEWYGIGGKISEITSDKLPRIYFKKGDTIICKYRDTNNAVDLRETIEIPNFAPAMEHIAPISARQGKIINIVPKVTDVDNDKLFLTFTEPFDKEGRWEDTIKYKPGIYTVTVTVSDGQEMVSQEVIVNLTEEYSDERESILERKLEYEDEVAKAELVRARRESKQFSQSKPGIELEFAINNPSIVLSRILFNVNKELLRYNIDIEGFPLSSRPRQYSKAPGQVYQYVETSVFDAENEDFENVSLTFMIGKNWFADNGISQYSVKLYEYFEGEWESMGAAKINDIGDAYTYEVKSDTLEGMYAVSADGEFLPTGAAVGVDDEDGLDFEIVNEGAGELVGDSLEDDVEAGQAVEKDKTKAEEKEEKGGFLGKAIIAIIVLAVLVGLYFVFSGRKTSEDFAGGERTGDREDFAREVKEADLESRRSEREAKAEERQRLAEEKQKFAEEKQRRREQEERRIEEERQRRKEAKLQRIEDERIRRQQERDLDVEEVDYSEYEDLSEASLIEERRRLARLDEERQERDSMRRQEQERIRKEEEIRMKRRAKATTKKPEAKKPVEEKPKKSNIKIISEDEWKDKMKKKKDDDLTIERLDEDL